MRKVLILLALVLSGCGSTSNFTAEDQVFAAMMVPHHEQAIEMSDLALAKSNNPEILELAKEIKAAQQPEIDQMISWGGSMMGSHDGHQMSGMLSDQELSELEAAEGVEFDRLFLIGMIKHHEGAIEMAKMVINSKTPEAANLGKEITSAQLQEIELMKKLLEKLSN